MSEVSFIQNIQNTMPKEAWYELNWYLLHHDDIDLRTAYKLYQDDDTDYNKWLQQNNINKIDPSKSIEKVLLAFLTDAIEVADTEGDISVQEYFKEKTLKSELEKGQNLRGK